MESNVTTFVLSFITVIICAFAGAFLLYGLWKGIYLEKELRIRRRRSHS